MAVEIELPLNGEGSSVTVENNMDRRSSVPLVQEMLQGLIPMVSPAGNLPEATDRFVEPYEAADPEVPENSSDVPQGGNVDALSITIDPRTEPANAPTASPRELLARALMTTAVLTLGMAMATVFYKGPKGVVFGHHRLAYYLVLAGIFIAGVAEAWTALWISGSPVTHTHRFSFGKVVLCASIGPLVFVLGMGGFAFIQG